jgi:DNA-binding FadR family transcriptional regulator
VLAADRAEPEALAPLRKTVQAIDDLLEDFPAYRQADVRFHIGLAESTGSGRLVAAMTDAQSAMTDLIAHIAHPPEVLAWANQQHRQLLHAVSRGDRDGAARVIGEHLHGTEHILAGLLPPVH